MKHLLTPEMEITVTTKSYTCDPFYNGAKEIQEQYMRMYQFDYKKSCNSNLHLRSQQMFHKQLSFLKIDYIFCLHPNWCACLFNGIVT